MAVATGRVAIPTVIEASDGMAPLPVVAVGEAGVPLR